jgi:hypothetical protein
VVCERLVLALTFSAEDKGALRNPTVSYCQTLAVMQEKFNSFNTFNPQISNIMAKLSGLKNAPSKTGKISGPGRSNNPVKASPSKGGSSKSGKK